MDTNVILYLLSGDQTLAELLNGKQTYLSFVTELELLSFGSLEEEEVLAIREFINDCTVINIPEKIKERTISIRQHYKLKLPDSIVAATSQYLKIPLLTADTDFKRVLEVNTIIYEF